METKRISDYVIRKLKEYAAIPSLTHHEDEFMNYQIADFGTPQGMEWMKVKIEGKQQAQFLHNVGDDSGLVFTVHTDRVPDADGIPFQNIIAECKEDGTITGQLDNLISIAILRYVIESGIKVNILFTTQEEICNSYIQVAAVADNFGLMPVSIDIDPVRSFEEGKERAITIREKSFSYLYEPETVRMLQEVAVRNNIPFETDYGYVCDEILYLIRAEQGTGCHLGLPLMNYHTNREKVKAVAVLSMIDLISAVSRADEFKRLNYNTIYETLSN